MTSETDIKLLRSEIIKLTFRLEFARLAHKIALQKADIGANVVRNYAGDWFLCRHSGYKHPLGTTNREDAELKAMELLEDEIRQILNAGVTQ